jgi:hypothetical protein
VEGTKPSSIRISIEEDGSFGYGLDTERRIAFDAPVVGA